MKRFLKNVALFCITGILFFIFAEGFCSTFFFVRANLPNLKNVFLTSPLSRARHEQYDARFGWRSIPNYWNPDYYGPGLGVRINSQGLRADYEYTNDIPAGKIRVICTGDSFTFGSDVDNRSTWCQKLMNADRRIETLNMGQGGYDLSQAYVRYLDDGKNFKHNIHLYTFILPCFDRLRTKKLYGIFEKPRLRLKGGKFLVENTPVPKANFFIREIYHVSDELGVQQLRCYQFLLSLYWKVFPGSRPDNDSSKSYEDLEPFTKILLDRLKELNQARGSTLVLVFLPQLRDYHSDRSDELRKWLREESAEKGILLIDLINDFRKISPIKIESYFRGHYSEKGNEYVANRIYEKLISEKETAALFKSKIR